ncbi:MAG: N-acetylglucosamine-6-phosphate deacetylase [Armatimonadota bacterium]
MTTLDAAFAITPQGILSRVSINISDGVINHITGDLFHGSVPRDADVLLPGFVDVHIHGGGGADTMDATPAALRAICRAHAKCGTTSLLATTITHGEAEIAHALENVANAIELQEAFCPDGARIAGVHLEGPFIHPLRPGAQPKEHVRLPDYDEWQRHIQHSRGTIRRVTIAAEYAEARPIIEWCWKNNVTVTVGHTTIGGDQLATLLNDGPLDATHLFNAMDPIHHRKPGPIPAFLTHPNAMSELIADGHHVHPDVIKMAVAAAGPEHIVAITDAMAGMGQGDGDYVLGGHPVKVANGKALLLDGTLAGSVLGMSQAATNIAAWTGCDLMSLAKMTSTNAADRIGRTDIGRIAVGAKADFVLMHGGTTHKGTFIRGIKVDA